MAADRRLLVSTRRNADRRLLANRCAARRPVASRSGSAALPRTGIANGRGAAKSPFSAPDRSAASSAAHGRRPDCRSRSSAGQSWPQDVDRHGLTLSDYSGWRRASAGRRSRLSLRPGSTRRRRHYPSRGQERGHGGGGSGNRQALPRRRNSRQPPERHQQCRDARTGPARRGSKSRAGRSATTSSISATATSKRRRGRALERKPRRDGGDRRAGGRGPAALKLSDDMLGLAWGKLLINMNNAVNALSGQTLRGELRKRDYRRVFAACSGRGSAC